MERFADGHMTSSLASPWANPDKHGPWKFREQVPALSSLLLEPAETQGGHHISRTCTAPHRTRSDRSTRVSTHLSTLCYVSVGRQDRMGGWSSSRWRHCSWQPHGPLLSLPPLQPPQLVCLQDHAARPRLFPDSCGTVRSCLVPDADTPRLRA